VINFCKNAAGVAVELAMWYQFMGVRWQL